MHLSITFQRHVQNDKLQSIQRKEYGHDTDDQVQMDAHSIITGNDTNATNEETKSEYIIYVVIVTFDL